MAYSTLAQIKSLFRKIKIEAATGDPATETVVTTEEVTEMIEEVDAEINAKLVDHYAIPITGTESLLIMRKISRMKVAHLIKTILEAKNQSSDRNKEVQTNLEAKADKMLLEIIPTWDPKCCEWVDPILQLSDAVRKNKSPRTSSVSSSQTTTRVIKRGGDNW